MWEQEVLQGNSLEKLRKTKINLSQNSWCQDSNQTPHKYNLEPQEPVSA
jgi:hypothetical protein